jgi:exodeoxyribonuclease VII large subunit
MTPAEALINAPEFTVSELSSALKRTVEDTYGHVRVRGEISGFRGAHSSGHCYFALKDETAKIEAVIWKFVHGRLRFKPQEGLEVIATGKLTTFPGSSKYQIVIEALEPAGVGALMALMEERKRKLAAEGLFDEARKQLLPWLPSVIGVVTSPTGAVIRDILHRLQDRFPRRVLVWPVRVQGEGSAEQIAGAIRGFNALAEGGRIPRPDLLIVARGGGSLEDLWSFNEEIVVRAAAESMIPLISAVGHETDVTLIDFAADKRAPTPTAAAEMAVPVRSELFVEVQGLARRTMLCWQRGQEARRHELRAAARAARRCRVAGHPSAAAGWRGRCPAPRLEGEHACPLPSFCSKQCTADSSRLARPAWASPASIGSVG